MKKYRIYLLLPNGEKIWCIGPHKRNQVTVNKESAGVFEVTCEIDEYIELLQAGFIEAWEHIPQYRNKPEWSGYPLKDINFGYEEV